MEDIIVVSTADWDHPLWTNKQHVTSVLASQGHKILYIESLGLRSAFATSKDLFRLLKRLLKGIRLPRKVAPNIWVFSPLVIPGRNQGIWLFINRILLNVQILIALLLTGIKKEWLWTYNPLTARLVNLKLYKKTIYHAVDAIHEQPYMPKKLIENEEKVLCTSVDQVFVTSPKIEESLRNYSKRITYHSNVCDFDHFHKALTKYKDFTPGDLIDIPRPRIGFIGALSSYKIDFELIADLAKRNPQWSFVFIGPKSEGEPNTKTDLLDHISNIYLLGYRPYQVLPKYCAGFDLAWLPLKINNYTQSMFPMKFFEYLAAGLPVVASEINSLTNFKKVAYLCAPSFSSFEKAIIDALGCNGPSLDVRIQLARKNTYLTRSIEMVKELRRI